MKRLIIKSVLVGIISTVAVCVFSGCKKDEVPIVQESDFELSHLPVPRELLKGDVAEIRCKITPTGDAITKYKLRYFQSSGKGVLKLEDGTLLKVNDSYPLSGKEFNLYYTSGIGTNQTIEVYVEDDFGHCHELVFSFARKAYPDFVAEYSVYGGILGMPISSGDLVTIKCKIISDVDVQSAHYTLDWKQIKGNGELYMWDNSILFEGYAKPIEKKEFNIYYKPLKKKNSGQEIHTIEINTKDDHGHFHKKNLSLVVS